MQLSFAVQLSFLLVNVSEDHVLHLMHSREITSSCAQTALI